VYRADLFRRPLSAVKVTEFFGSVSVVKQTQGRYPIASSSDGDSAASGGDGGRSCSSSSSSDGGDRCAGLLDGAQPAPRVEAAPAAARSRVCDGSSSAGCNASQLLAGPRQAVDWATLSGLAGLAVAVGLASTLQQRRL
jgi:hypothetical protein